jgi:hypothetical protein
MKTDPESRQIKLSYGSSKTQGYPLLILKPGGVNPNQTPKSQLSLAPTKAAGMKRKMTNTCEPVNSFLFT